jgi:hypothetical protein
VTPEATPTASETLPPTATEIPPTHTPAPTPSATEGAAESATPAGTAGSPTAGTPATAAAGENKAEFVEDVTVPDGTNFTPGEAFVKTWRLKNVGTNAWGAGYVLAYAKGEQMGGPPSVPLPGSVAPGETVDISVDLTAPDRLGSFTGFWQLRTDTGTPFGIGPEANEPVYVQINVAASGNATAAPTATGNASPAPTGAASASPGPTAAGGTLQVTGATMSVDEGTRTGACPQTFVFSAVLESRGAGTMSYRLEAASDTPGFDFTLPDPNQSVFTSAGPRTFTASYTLEFSGSVSGQMWVHVLAPNELETNKVSFGLTCEPAGGE